MRTRSTIQTASTHSYNSKIVLLTFSSDHFTIVTCFSQVFTTTYLITSTTILSFKHYITKRFYINYFHRLKEIAHSQVSWRKLVTNALRLKRYIMRQSILLMLRSYQPSFNQFKSLPHSLLKLLSLESSLFYIRLVQVLVVTPRDVSWL